MWSLMEKATKIVEVCTSTWPIWTSIYEWLNHQAIVENKHRALEEKMKGVRVRKRDVEVELQDAQFQRRKKRRVEVDEWLKEVEERDGVVKNIGEQVQNRRYFSRSRFLRQVDENIQKANELFDQGASFLRGGAFIELHRDEPVKLIITGLIGETTAQKNLKKIWTCLEKGEKQSIGVWGMGGIGKTTVVTHIQNRLFEKKDIFGPVYWVTVSRESSIRKLQDAIAQRIGSDLSNEEDERMRSSLLFHQLKERNKFVLVLDDVWEAYSPKEVGIPLGVCAGKLIVTSRFQNVCLGMGCAERIKMESLSTGESWELFNKMLCRPTGLSEKEAEIAKEIVEECDGLPLAIITTARSLMGVYEINVWKNALNEMREPIQRHTVDIDDKVFKILGFSYNHLKDENVQECLLYCALFPEDYEIPKLPLIRYWIAEGLVDEMGSWLAELQRGHAILNKLENACLLERCLDNENVKMHDVIRDMAINISAKNRRFMVKAGRNMNGLASQREWSENLERVSFMRCRGLSLTSLAPNCPKLSTLFLQENNIKEVPKALFEQMRSLKVLDLSVTPISFLPDSISDLVNLRALLLFGCFKLEHVPSLGKLTELRELDLSESGVEAIPDGMEKLVLLKRLSLRNVMIEESPSLRRALPNLLHLQCLRLDGWTELDVGVELIGLRELQILGINFSSLQNFNSYVKTDHCENLHHYALQLNSCLPDENFSGRKVSVVRYEEGKEEDKLVLPTNIQLLKIHKSVLPASLSHVFPSHQILKDLKKCEIAQCAGIEYLWCAQDCSASLHSLRLEYLPDLRLLFKLPTTNYTSFFSLNRLFIRGCPNIKHMFTPGLVKHHLQNLQSITVCDCQKMKDIIMEEEEEEEINEMNEEEEEINEMNNPILCFPNLRKLELENLQELESIWKGTMTCDSLRKIRVWECPKVRRIPVSVSVHMNNGDGERRASTPPLEKIEVQQEWWNLVEWDAHRDAKSVFQPLLISAEARVFNFSLMLKRKMKRKMKMKMK